LNGLSAKDTAQNRNDFSEWRNEVGFKAPLEAFITMHMQSFRTGRMKSPTLVNNNSFNEVFIGGELIERFLRNGALAQMVSIYFLGAFSFMVWMTSPWLDLEYTKAVYKPTSMQQDYQGYFFNSGPMI